MQMLDRPAHPLAGLIAYIVLWPFLCFLILTGCSPQTETDRVTIRAEAARAKHPLPFRATATPTASPEPYFIALD